MTKISINNYRKRYGLKVDLYPTKIKHEDGRTVYFVKFKMPKSNKHNKTTLDRNEIKVLTQKYINQIRKYHGNQGSYGITLKYRSNYKTSGSQLFGTEPHLWSYQENYEDENNPNDMSEFEEFYIGFSYFGKKAGGKDINNNCLLILIANLINAKGTNLNYTNIKKSIGLKKDEMIPIDKIEELEKLLNEGRKLNIGINIDGPTKEFEYRTKYPNAKHIIPVYLSNNHYRFNGKIAFKDKHTRYNKDKDSNLCIYKYVSDKEIEYCINAKEEAELETIEISKDYFEELKKDEKNKSLYEFITKNCGNYEEYFIKEKLILETEIVLKEKFEELKKDKLNPEKYLFIKYEYIEKHKTIQEYFRYYDKFCSKVNMLSKEYFEIVRGEKIKVDYAINNNVSELNLRRTGSILNTILRAFYQYNISLNSQPLTQEESQSIKNSSSGSIIWCINQFEDMEIKYQGPSSHYDMKRYFSSILLDQNLMIPFRQGTYYTITKEEFKKKFKDKMEYYGIYKCQITSNDPWIKLNKTEYTHLFIDYLMNISNEEYYYKIELIECENNFLRYDISTLIKSHKLFEGILNQFIYIENEYKEAKILRNMLWGGLCQRYEKTVAVKFDEKYTIFDGYEITKYSLNSKKQIELKTQNRKMESTYKTDYARLKPFLLSESTIRMHKILRKIRSKVVRIQTDGFITTEPIEKELKEYIKNEDGFLVNKSEENIEIDIVNVNTIYYKGTKTKIFSDLKN